MRDVLIGLAIPVALLWALFSASGSILVLNWIWFQRPYDFSWGVWNTMPMFQIALAIAVVSNVIRGQFRPRVTPLLAVYFLLLTWVTVSTLFAFNVDRSWNFYKIMLPSMWVAPIVMFATVHDLRLLKMVIWVFAGSLCLNGFKVGLMSTFRGQALLTDEISGFVGDNNMFGLVLGVACAVLVGLRNTLPKRAGWRAAFWTVLGFALLAVVFTKSRGAMLSLAVAFVLGSLASHRPIRNSMVLMFIATVAFLAVPDEYFDRLSTISEYREDVSAMGRIENWSLAWNAAVANPVTGVGPDNHVPYNNAVVKHGVQVRVAHSVYFQTLGELGFPGLALYLLFVSMALWILHRTWREAAVAAKSHADLAWVRDLAFWMMCGYVGFLFGAAFLNMFYVEFPWYVAFYGSMLGPLLGRELATRASAASTPASPVKAAPSGALARERVRGKQPWRAT